MGPFKKGPDRSPPREEAELDLPGAIAGEPSPSPPQVEEEAAGVDVHRATSKDKLHIFIYKNKHFCNFCIFGGPGAPNIHFGGPGAPQINFLKNSLNFRPDNDRKS